MRTETALPIVSAVKAHPGSIGSIATRLGRDRSAVTREIAQLQRFGFVRVVEQVLPGHGRMKKVSSVANEIRLETIIA